MTHYPLEHLILCARAIRPYLATLLDADTAANLDKQIVRLLKSAQKEPMSATWLIELLCISPQTRNWSTAYLDGIAPLGSILFLNYIDPLIPRNRNPNILEYACPKCGHRYFVYGLPRNLPKCDTCGENHQLVVGRLVCQKGDYEFPLFELAQVPVRRCPTHGKLFLARETNY